MQAKSIDLVEVLPIICSFLDFRICYAQLRVVCQAWNHKIVTCMPVSVLVNLHEISEECFFKYNKKPNHIHIARPSIPKYINFNDISEIEKSSSMFKNWKLFPGINFDVSVRLYFFRPRPFEVQVDSKIENTKIEKYCDYCGDDKPIFKCAKCNCVFYCQKSCQIAAWKTHKLCCKPPDGSKYSRNHLESDIQRTIKSFFPNVLHICLMSELSSKPKNSLLNDCMLHYSTDFACPYMSDGDLEHAPFLKMFTLYSDGKVLDHRASTLFEALSKIKRFEVFSIHGVAQNGIYLGVLNQIQTLQNVKHFFIDRLNAVKDSSRLLELANMFEKMKNLVTFGTEGPLFSRFNSTDQQLLARGMSSIVNYELVLCSYSVMFHRKYEKEIEALVQLLPNLRKIVIAIVPNIIEAKFDRYQGSDEEAIFLEHQKHIISNDIRLALPGESYKQYWDRVLPPFDQKLKVLEKYPRIDYISAAEGFVKAKNKSLLESGRNLKIFFEIDPNRPMACEQKKEFEF